jgi:hypothetical protein
MGMEEQKDLISFHESWKSFFEERYTVGCSTACLQNQPCGRQRSGGSQFEASQSLLLPQKNHTHTHTHTHTNKKASRPYRKNN